MSLGAAKERHIPQAYEIVSPRSYLILYGMQSRSKTVSLDLLQKESATFFFCNCYQNNYNN